VSRPWRRRAVAAAVGLLILAGAGSIVRGYAGEQPGAPSIAVGYVADFSGDDTAHVARIIPELLTTNLSRLDGISVVTRTRLLELMDGDRHEPGPADFTRAAQLAGVRQVIDGAVYRDRDGAWRLDVRVLDATTGRVRQVHAMRASDVFALADSATTRLASGFGLASQEALRIADVTTSSIVAFRFYEEGLRALRRTDLPGAQRLFDAALRADSTFAMAAFAAYHAHHPMAGERAVGYLERARRHASRATERERLIINATWALWLQAPGMVAAVEEVVRRFPSDPESHLLMAQALLWSGNFSGALLAARQVVLMDSTLPSVRCLACEALEAAARSYIFMDSLDAASRLARSWIARDDSTQRPWRIVRDVALAQDDVELAAAAHRRVQSLGSVDRWEDHAIAVNVALRSGDFAAVTAHAIPVMTSGKENEQRAVLWWQTIAERHAGRLTQALRTSERLRRLAPEDAMYMQLQAQVLREARQYRRAAALFDSAVVRHRTRPRPSHRGRHVAWVMTQQAGALAAANIIEPLPRLADSIESHGGQSGYGRDPRLHHHVRGLWHAAHRRDEAAIDAFRKAMWSSTGGYTRTNFELARLLLERGRSHEAIGVLRAALAAGFESVGLYVTQTEMRALLAHAHARAGNADSARKHHQWVSRALAQADPDVRDRIQRMVTAGQ
jgi:TolB-like protein/tetratricopeptide (TPR) repeat protein